MSRGYEAKTQYFEVINPDDVRETREDNSEKMLCYQDEMVEKTTPEDFPAGTKRNQDFTTPVAVQPANFLRRQR